MFIRAENFLKTRCMYVPCLKTCFTLPGDEMRVFYPSWSEMCVCFTLPGDEICVSPCLKTRTWREKSNHIQTLVLCALVYDRSVCTNSSRMKINTHITVTHTTYRALLPCIHVWHESRRRTPFSFQWSNILFRIAMMATQAMPSQGDATTDVPTPTRNISVPTETSRSLHSNRR